MKKMQVFAAALVIGCVLTATASRAQQAGLTRTDLQRHDLSVPGYETVQVRVDFAPGAIAARHSHHGEEIIYVLAGSLEYQIDGSAPVIVNAGQVFYVPAGAIHQAKNVGNTMASELATYVVEKGQPLVTPAP
jgi:quercetin dioxygenase-like cupin family protein